MKEEECALCDFVFVLKVYFSQVSRCARSLVLHRAVLLVLLLLLSAVSQSFPESVLYQLTVAVQHGLSGRKPQLQREHETRRFIQKPLEQLDNLGVTFRKYSIILASEYLGTLMHVHL